MMRIIFWLLGICIALSSLSAHAALFVEPYVGYGTGSMSIKTSSTETTNTNAYVGPSLGAKLGWYIDYLYIFLDMQSTVYNNTEQTVNSTAPTSLMGIGLGFDWNIPIRLLYIVDSKFDVTIGDDNFSGSGSRLSIGYYLDLDTIISIDQVSGSHTTDSGSTALTSDFNATLLTISFPIEFTYPKSPWKDRTR